MQLWPFGKKRIIQQANLDFNLTYKSLFSDAFGRIKKNKLAMFCLVVVILITLVAVFAPWLAPHDPLKQDLDNLYSPPSAKYLLGTDNLGRDILSRIIYGSRVSLSVGLVAETIAITIGVLIGTLAGYYGGWIDNLISRIMEVFASFPHILFAMAVMFARGPGIFNVFIAIGIVGWTGVARIIRGQIMQLKSMEYVEAAKIIGSSPVRIIFRHLIPNCLSTIIVIAAMSIPANIMLEAALSFIGLGVQPPEPSWGSMISVARKYIRNAPHFSIYPGVAIMITVLAFNLLGDGLSEALDPRMKKG